MLFRSPNITINIIEDEKIKEKIKPELPNRVIDILKCKNPRCITGTEGNVCHIFVLVDKEKCEYRCEYCDEIYNFSEL